MIDSIASKQQPYRGRRAVIQFLKTEGPMTAQAISERLGVTAMAVRQHLYELVEQGMVTFAERGQGGGRPSKHWRLTSSADSFFPDGHAELAVGLIHTVRAAFGELGNGVVPGSFLGDPPAVVSRVIAVDASFPSESVP